MLFIACVASAGDLKQRERAGVHGKHIFKRKRFGQ